MKSLRVLRPAALLLARPRSSLALPPRISATCRHYHAKNAVWRRHQSTSANAAVESTDIAQEQQLVAKAEEDGLGISIPSGKRKTLPYFWLRDNCRCPKCINKDTRQRNFNTFAIPSDIRPTHINSTPTHVDVRWSDGHISHYDWDFLSFYLNSDRRDRRTTTNLHLWGAEIAENLPTAVYSEVMASEHAVADLTAKIKEYGFAFIKETPFEDPDLTRQLLERIAFIRLTHYGGFYDFTPNLAMADTAYTNLALPAHTDNTYFTDPSGLQAFHLLSHTPPRPKWGEAPIEQTGGESLLVDGFNAARILQQEDPKAYDILSTVRLPWHASGNAGITITPDKLYPVLELDQDTGELLRVRWNNDDRGVVPFGEKYTPTEWYEAARKWDEILRRKESEFWIQLKPGMPLVFDNWRVLHGRSAFEGVRRICGAYINRDDWISRWRNTNFGRKEVLDTVIG